MLPMVVIIDILDDSDILQPIFHLCKTPLGFYLDSRNIAKLFMCAMFFYILSFLDIL